MIGIGLRSPLKMVLVFSFRTSLASEHTSPTSWNLRTGHVTCNGFCAKGSYQRPLVREALMPKISTRPRYQGKTISLVAGRLHALRELISRHPDRSPQNPPTHRHPRPSIGMSLQTSPLTTQQAVPIKLNLLNHGRHNSITFRLSSTPSNSDSTPNSRNYAQAFPSRCGTLPLRQPILRRPSKVSIGYPMTGR